MFSYTYQAGTPFESPALFEDQFRNKGWTHILLLVGHTGGGKSTITIAEWASSSRKEVRD